MFESGKDNKRYEFMRRVRRFNYRCAAWETLAVYPRPITQAVRAYEDKANRERGK